MVSMFVEEGSLDRYLRLHKDDLNSFTLLSWAEQIADGMAYLEERGIIHRYVAIICLEFCLLICISNLYLGISSVFTSSH